MYQQEDKMHPHGSSWSLSVFLSPSIFRGYSFQNWRLFPLRNNVLPQMLCADITFFHHFLLFVSMAVADLRKRQMSLQSDSTFPFCPTKKMLLSLTHTHIHNQTLCVLLHLWSTRIQKSQMVMMMCFFYFLLGT